jgi:hypothetical protein
VTSRFLLNRTISDSEGSVGDPNFQSPIGGVVLVVVDVAVVWMKSPHNVLVASLRVGNLFWEGVGIGGDSVYSRAYDTQAGYQHLCKEKGCKRMRISAR